MSIETGKRVMEEQIKKLVSINSWFLSFQIITLISVLGAAVFLYTALDRFTEQIAGNSSVSDSPPVGQDISNWRDLIHDHNARSTDQLSEIVLVEFSDFQCPFCKIFTDTTREQIISEYGDRVTFIFKHYPLDQIHDEAMPAAIASQCALRENKFWEIKELFFKNQDYISTDFIIEAGTELGLSDNFTRCVANQETLSEVEKDIQDASSLNVRGTPTFIVNGKMVVGTMSMDHFRSIVESDL